MQNEIIEAMSASIACNGPSGLQYAWHTDAARAAYAVAFPAAIEMAAKVAERNGLRAAVAIRALVKEIG